MGLDLFERPQRAQAALAGGGSGEAFLAGLAIVGLKSGGLWEKDRKFFVDIHASYIMALEQLFPVALLEAERVDDRINSDTGRLRNYVSRMILPALGAVIQKEARRVAMLRMTQTIIAIERYRLAHDGLPPASIDELTPGFLPSVLADPFDGQPLRYRRLNKGCVVYSLGTDKEDDGGDLEPEGKQPKDDRFRIFR